MAASILDVVSLQINHIASVRHGEITSGLAEVAVQGASNILLGVQQMVEESMAREIVAKTEDAVQNVLKVRLSESHPWNHCSWVWKSMMCDLYSGNGAIPGMSHWGDIFRRLVAISPPKSTLLCHCII